MNYFPKHFKIYVFCSCLYILFLLCQGLYHALKVCFSHVWILCVSLSEPDNLFVLPKGQRRGDDCSHPQLSTLPFLPSSVAVRWQTSWEHRLCILWVIYTSVKMFCSNIWWSSKKGTYSQILHYQFSLKTKKEHIFFFHILLDNTVQVVYHIHIYIYIWGIFKH